MYKAIECHEQCNIMLLAYSEEFTMISLGTDSVILHTQTLNGQTSQQTTRHCVSFGQTSIVQIGHERSMLDHSGQISAQSAYLTVCYVSLLKDLVFLLNMSVTRTFQLHIII